MMHDRNFLIFSLALILAGCMNAPEHRAAVQSDEGDRLTVGTVQREIRVGMSGAEVAGALGSPNIVSTDERGREVWIYDKVSTDRVNTASTSYGTLIILGGNTKASSSSQRQRTLTIFIKFDQEKRVRDFAYNYTQF